MILQPLTHKIKRASARSSHMFRLPYPLLPLHSMLKVAKLFPFGGGLLKPSFICATLIPGVIWDCLVSLICYLFINIESYILFKSCKRYSVHRTGQCAQDPYSRLGPRGTPCPPADAGCYCYVHYYYYDCVIYLYVLFSLLLLLVLLLLLSLCYYYHYHYYYS